MSVDITSIGAMSNTKLIPTPGLIGPVVVSFVDGNFTINIPDEWSTNVNGKQMVALSLDNLAMLNLVAMHYRLGV